MENQKKNRPPTQEEFLKHVAELEKQNLYGGAIDSISPLLAGTIAGNNPFTKALLQKNPLASLITSHGLSELGDYGGLKSTQKINDASLSPDMKYLRKLKEKDKEAQKKYPNFVGKR